MTHKEELTERATQLQSEILEIQKNFELKKEEFLKVQGARKCYRFLTMRKQVKKLDELIIKKSNPRLFKQMYETKTVHCCPKCGNITI